MEASYRLTKLIRQMICESVSIFGPMDLVVLPKFQFQFLFQENVLCYSIKVTKHGDSEVCLYK